MCPSNYNRFSDRARYWWKIVIFSYPLAFDAPVKGVPVGTSPSRLACKNYTVFQKTCDHVFDDKLN